jgi:hypothetical protein
MPRVSWLFILVAGCTGIIGDPGIEPGEGTGEEGTGEEDGMPPLSVEPSDLRRLSQRELDAVLRDLLGETGVSTVGVVPGERSVFDERFDVPEPGSALVDGFEGLATELAARAVADPARRAAILGCEPSGPDDVECMRAFIARFGRRALRRPLTETESEEYLALHVEYATHPRGSFDVGAETVIRALLMHPELMYHVEVGEPALDGLVRLGPFETASRMAFFLWGTAPDDWLLDVAEAGELRTDEGRRAVARAMLDDPRARAQLDHFHASWMGYDALPHDPMLVRSMRNQTRASIERVVFDERRSWLDLFRMEETFLDGALAEHYGLPAPPGPGAAWVDVSDSDRGSLLSHGSFLSVEGKFDDTSPVQRGLLISTRLMCLVILEPTAELMVDVDEPPPGDGCKPERYAMHSSGGCAGCHQYLDPVGMGLEAYDNLGRFRTHEPGRPECATTAEGNLPGVGALIASGSLDECVVTQLYRFAVGRHHVEAEGEALDVLAGAFRAGGHELDALLVELVASPTFVHRKLPATEEE